MNQRAIPAVWMRGGTSKGLFFHAADLPPPGAERDRLLLRLLGSPDPYGKQIDGIGGGVSTTSKAVVITSSEREGYDVEYCFGHVAIDRPLVDWSGNCGNLSAAVGPFAIEEGLLQAQDPITQVRIWQANISKGIIARVPTRHGLPLVDGSFEVDGIPFSGAAIDVEFLDPGGSAELDALLPTGNTRDELVLSDGRRIEASLINAGNPTVFVRASDLGLTGSELQPEINANQSLLEQFEALRCAGAVAMRLSPSTAHARESRPATPKISFVAAPADYLTSAGRWVSADSIDLRARILSMGLLHHAYTGTGAVALAAAAKLPGSLVHEVARNTNNTIFIQAGHVAGTLKVGAEVFARNDSWHVVRVVMQRTARRLMQGQVFAPMD